MYKRVPLNEADIVDDGRRTDSELHASTDVSSHDPIPDASTESSYFANNACKAEASEVIHQREDASSTSGQIRAEPVALSRPQPDRHASVALLRRLLYDTWLAEIALMLLSIACLVTVSVILACYQGRPVDEFKPTLSLNTVAAILIAATRISLAFVTTSCLGQMKWCRMTRNARALKDLQDMDEASRGPLGSLLLLFGSKIVSISGIGAAVLILLLTTDAFLQQSIATKFELRAVDFQEATMPTTDYYPQVALWKRDANFYGLVQSVIWSGAFQYDPAVCSSGDCTWPEYEYTGWCHDCEFDKQLSDWQGCEVTIDNFTKGGDWSKTYVLPCNLTHPSGFGRFVWPADVTITGQAFGIYDTTTTHSLDPPSNFVFNRNYDNYYQLWKGDPWNGDSWEGGYGLWSHSIQDGSYYSVYEDGVVGSITNPLYPRTAVFLDWSYDESAKILRSQVNRTIDCALSRCRKRFEATVTNGTLSARPKGTTMLTEYSPNAMGNYTIKPSYLTIKDNYTNIPYRPFFCYKDMALPQPRWSENMEHDIFFNNVSLQAWRWSDPSTWTTCMYSRSDTKYRFMINRTLDEDSNTESLQLGEKFLMNQDSNMLFAKINHGNDLPKAFANLTTMLDYAGLRASNQTTLGAMYVNTPIIAVRWEWLILPVLLEVMGLVFFVLVVLQTRRMRVRIWKTSILPFIYHGVPREELSEGSSDRSSDMLRDAECVKARMDACDGTGLYGRRLRVVQEAGVPGSSR
ncbi:uncharacterized protein AB675_1014 [Cyphellophora attinorum]|uniref:Uncharacterized protein n=1 Tax=Cyphellophora attinorum TaxID=1664694 RepID=A0A0N1HM03_9EURO|nr:uncharacterized protein AB675_1014 [Phialophora attinorum]KPI38172.1 hypothetical protein AB675_1014 [Phialophora attinorum]